jgi:hypothetical protein
MTEKEEQYKRKKLRGTRLEEMEEEHEAELREDKERNRVTG